MKQRLILVGIGAVVLLVIVRAVMARSSAGGDVAVDTTGASAPAGGTPRVTPNATGLTQTAVAVPGLTPGGTPLAKPNRPGTTPIVVQIQGTAVSIAAKPLLLLNPSTVRQGSSVGVTGSGFDPGATVDIFVKQQVSDSVDPLTFVQVDKSGGFGGVAFAVPDSLPRGNFIVQATQRESDHTAVATAVVAGGSPQVKLGTQAAKSGDVIQLSATGFGPDEDVNVYWNDLSSDIIGTIHTDDSGGVRQGSVRVPFGAVGNNGFIFVGDKSQSPVTVPFQMLNLYPNVDLSSYAIKPDNVLSFSGKDFGPGEQVTVYLNDPNAPALTTIQADDTGGFTNAGGFLVPFGLRGKQTLIFMGEESKAPTTASFDTLPYTPSAQPSTYGGRPGTTLTYYAIGFARNEIVHAFTGVTQDSPGLEVSCFRTDPQGNAASGGSYVVPGDATPGQLVFSLVGSRSLATATAALEVIAPDVPVLVPPQAPFECDLTDGPDVPQVVGEPDGPSIPLPSVANLEPAAAGAPPAAGGQPDVAPNRAAAPKPSAAPQASPAVVARASATPVASRTPAALVSATPKASPTADASAKASPTPAARASSTPKTSTTATVVSATATVVSATATPSAPEPAAAAPQRVTVQAGDTLPAIAQRVYGDANLWTTIYDANRATIGNNPNIIKTGTELTIPDRTP